MSHGLSRAARLRELERLYVQPGHGHTDIELAQRFGVDRTAIYKDRQLLEADGLPLIETERGRYTVDRRQYLSHIRVNLHEALILYLAARRLNRHTRTAQKHVVSALEKLAMALQKPMTERLVKAAAKVLEQAPDPKQESVLETLARSWAEQIKVRIWYRALRNEQIKIHVVAPYLIEPSLWSDGAYVFGQSDIMPGLTPFKVERIEKAVLTTERYEIDDTFDDETLFQYAWGIWRSEEEPETVKLRFSGKRAIRRLQESIWHRTQDLVEQDDGSYLWTAQVAEWREMLPWVRGWGADCEVEGPDELRDEIKGQAWKLAHVYNLTTQATDIDSRLLRLWGKTTEDPDRFHPALYHMFDVAYVAQQLLSPRASSRWRQVLANALNAEAETLSEWLPFVIALHDLGKLSVPFQVLNTEQQKRLQAEGFSFGKAIQADGHKLHHSIVGRLVLEEMITGWPEYLAAAFREMVSGHHGLFQRDSREHRTDYKRVREGDEWFRFRQRAVQILESYLLQQWPHPLPNPTNQSAAMVALNGFCILCDWLGSDEQYFTPAPHTPLAEYIPKSRQRAHDRVRDAGFFQVASSTAPTQFAALFNDFRPRPLQTAIDDIPGELLCQPTLTIIEAPTGEGKTEAALALARRIGAIRGTDELYVALPTTATSNAMFDRVQEHLQKRLGLPQELVNLVHGQAFLKTDDLPLKPMHSVELEGETVSPSMEWFGPKKKALLAPFGVGTVDQAELAALNVRHNALRMIGLAGKTIILDEVHAYDTYMTTIIKRMLTWLSALGSSVILLSATLPTARRRELAQAFAGDGLETPVNLDAYPNILTIGPAAHHLSTPAAFQPDKTIFLHRKQFADEDAEAKAIWLLEQVQQGGCACWITNTVVRAQQIYAALLQNAPTNVTLDLLHARFPLTDRQAREEAILNKYSNREDVKRPPKAIVVGTQVLEQSLDLDFDVMMTDLAPVDLVLQRAGRLHRHEREAGARGTHRRPHLHLNTTIHRADKKIYDEYILEKTLAALEDRNTLILPDDYRPLIEGVYDETPPTPDDPLFSAWENLMGKRDTLEDEAELRLMNDPDPDYPFYRGSKPQDFKEDEDSSGWMIAQTRWGQESLTVIPLLRDGELARTVSGNVSAPIDQKADRQTQLDLLRHSLRISHQTLVKHLKAPTELCKLFAGSALLRNCVPLWLEPGQEAGEFVNQELPILVRLHPQLGLVIGELSGVPIIHTDAPL